MKLKLLFILLFFCSIINAQSKYKIKKTNSKWGVNSTITKSEIIKPLYDSIFEIRFESKPTASTGFFSCIKKDSSYILNAASKKLLSFSRDDSIELISIKDYFIISKQYKWIYGFIHKISNTAIPIDSVYYEQKNGVYFIKSKNKYGILQGYYYEDKICLMPKYDSIIPCENQSYLFKLKNKYGLYSFANNKTPIELFPCLYDEINLLTEIKAQSQSAPPPPGMEYRKKDVIWEGKKSNKKIIVKDYNKYVFKTFMGVE